MEIINGSLVEVQMIVLYISFIIKHSWHNTAICSILIRWNLEHWTWEHSDASIKSWLSAVKVVSSDIHC